MVIKSMSSPPETQKGAEKPLFVARGSRKVENIRCFNADDGGKRTLLNPSLYGSSFRSQP